MANELNCPTSTSGQTVTAKLFAAGAQVGTTISCTEIGSTAVYTADMPAVAAGLYGVVFYVGSTVVGVGQINWSGTAEVLLPKEFTSSTFASAGVFSTGALANAPSGGGGGTIQNNITVPPSVAAASQSPSVLPIVTYNTLRRTLPDMGDITTRQALVFTLKNAYTDADADSLIQVSEDDGLIYADGAVAGDSTKASLTVDDEDLGTVILYVDESITALLSATDGIRDARVWDCKWKNASGDWNAPIGGKCLVAAGVGRVIS